MFFVDVQKLKGKIVERGYNNTSFSKACGINRNTLAGYYANPEVIPYRMIVVMSNLLCDDIGEAMTIFFAHKLS